MLPQTRTNHHLFNRPRNRRLMLELGFRFIHTAEKDTLTQITGFWQNGFVRVVNLRTKDDPRWQVTDTEKPGRSFIRSDEAEILAFLMRELAGVEQGACA